MGAARKARDLSVRDLEPILMVANKLAAHFDLQTMLGEVSQAGRQVLRADRVSVWLYDATTDELYMNSSPDLGAFRIPAGKGLAGSCARQRRLINVPDCYADQRFDPGVDLLTGYPMRCMLALPLIDHEGVLVGVLQVINKLSGTFDEGDEALATMLAAQCAVALQRARMTVTVLEGERMRQELEIAREVQLGTLPAAMPVVAGYDLCGTFKPAELTGGDTFDLQMLDQGLLVVLGDATGHGMGPALTVAHLQAMLRMAFSLGADLDTAFTHVNNLLASMLPADRFICAFIGLLDPRRHRIRFHSGGHGPVLFFRAATGQLDAFEPTSFPVAAMPIPTQRAAATLEFGPGDVLVLVSDGILEYRNPTGEEFGVARVHEILREHQGKTMAELARFLLDSVRSFACGAPQEDDITAVLIRRDPPTSRSFDRSLASLEAIFAFVGAAFASQGLDETLRAAIEFAIEELFTNILKYGRGGEGQVQITLAPIPQGVEATLVDHGAEPFDVTQFPAVDTDLPIEQREPGGLGLHLVRGMVDSIDYEYRADIRQTRITVRKRSAGGPEKVGGHVQD
jgi:phosphoserine phosphatase